MSFITFLDTVQLQRPVVNTGTDRFNVRILHKKCIYFPKSAQQINFPRNINRFMLHGTRTVFSVRYELGFYSYVIQTNIILKLLSLQLIFSRKMFGHSQETFRAVNFLPSTAINIVPLCTVVPLFLFLLLLHHQPHLTLFNFQSFRRLPRQ